MHRVGKRGHLGPASYALFVACAPQVIQATSILFQNTQRPTSLYMLLSQDHINRLIQPERGHGDLPMHDEEFVTHYVALLKAISIRLGADTVRAR